MDDRDRQLFAQLAQRRTNGVNPRRQLRGLPGIGGGLTNPPIEHPDIVVDEEPAADPKQHADFIEHRGCQEANAMLIGKIHTTLKQLKGVKVQLVFREPVWHGLIQWVKDHNPMFKGDPNLTFGNYLGAQAIANFDPADDEVLVEREGDLPTITLKIDLLPRFAAYWRARGKHQ